MKLVFVVMDIVRLHAVMIQLIMLCYLMTFITGICRSDAEQNGISATWPADV